MKSRKTELLLRMYLVIMGFVLFAFLLVYKTVKINVIEGDKWRATRDSLYVDFQPVKAERGNILADDGSLLATSMPIFEIRMDLKTPALTDKIFNAHIDSLAFCLSKYVNPEKSPSQFKNYLIKKRRKGDRYALIARNVNYILLEKIEKFPIFSLGKYKGGLIIERDNKREKPYRRLASRTIGVERENAQTVGLEKAYDLFLKGKDGKRLEQRVPPGIWIPVNDLSEIEPRHGDDVLTTINIEIQDIVDRALMKAMLHHEAEWGTAVVMEVKTGAIKAIANLGKTESGYWENYNYAIGKSTEPGSTFKLATMLALLEDGKINLHDNVNLEGGRYSFYNKPIKDSHIHGIQDTTIQYAFETSSNVGMAKLAVKYYGKDKKAGDFINRLKQFGLDKRVGIEIAGEGKPVIKEAYNYNQGWSGLSLPWMSHGYEVQLTPLQTLAFYNAIANNGKKVKPYLVEEVQSAGVTKESLGSEILIENMVSPESVRNAKILLQGVISNNESNKHLKPDNYTMAGKTGTALFGYGKGSTRRKYQASFAGFFPVENPEYSMIVVIRDPRKNGFYGSRVAGPVFKEISDRLMSNKKIETFIATQAELLDADHTPVYNIGYADDIKEILNYTGIKYSSVDTTDWVVSLPNNAELINNSLVIKDKNFNGKIVPDVTGMGLRDAIYILELKGLRVKARGFGKIKNQSIQPGIKITGQEIQLTLG